MAVMIGEESWPVCLDYTYEHLRLGRKRRGVPVKSKPVNYDAPGGKECIRCREIKPPSEFFPLRSAPDGLQHNCKECERAIKRAWYARNNETVQRRKEAQRIRSREWKRRKFGFKPRAGAA